MVLILLAALLLSFLACLIFCVGLALGHTSGVRRGYQAAEAQERQLRENEAARVVREASQLTAQAARRN
jgi:hypothetical protein